MNHWTPSRSLKLTRLLNIATIFLGVAALFCIPICTEWYDAVSGQEPIRNLLNVIFYLTVFLALIALWKLNGLLSRIIHQQIFVSENVTVLRIISWCCFGISALFLFLTFYRFLAFIVAFAAGFFGLIIRVLKNVFELAVNLREEQDFTI